MIYCEYSIIELTTLENATPVRIGASQETIHGACTLLKGLKGLKGTPEKGTPRDSKKRLPKRESQ